MEEKAFVHLKMGTTSGIMVVNKRRNLEKLYLDVLIARLREIVRALKSKSEKALVELREIGDPISKF